MSDRCFDCGAPAECMHHVVPRSMGGTATVPLCGACHAKVHGLRAFRVGELTRQSMKSKRERGEYTGGEPPYGWDRVDGKLVVNDAEQAVLHKVGELRAHGLSLRATAAELARRGHLSRAAKPFVHRAIASMTKEEA